MNWKDTFMGLRDHSSGAFLSIRVGGWSFHYRKMKEHSSSPNRHKETHTHWVQCPPWPWQPGRREAVTKRSVEHAFSAPSLVSSLWIPHLSNLWAESTSRGNALSLNSTNEDSRNCLEMQSVLLSPSPPPRSRISLLLLHLRSLTFCTWTAIIVS